MTSERWSKASPQAKAAAVVRAKRWKQANPDRVRVHKTRENERNRARRKEDPALRERETKAALERYYADRDRQKANNRAYLWRWRLEMVFAYGGRCTCCGEEEPAFLTLDHIGGWGATHRRVMKLRGGRQTYRWLKQQGWPQEGFGLLCCNCQAGVQQPRGCPHQPQADGSEPTLTYRVRWWRELRAQMRRAYGDRCACCGETEPVFLTLDHVHGGGRAESVLWGVTQSF